mmetsp:Transcript_57952/g.93772  ORF Transcript_57952/g.93772 Transcript_57952/m.93772 type:complete len:126 (-) Transcript_57952:178-555(-)
MQLPPQFVKVGLPFLSFMVIGWLGLQEGLKAKFKEGERRKRYIEPEKPEDILKKMRGEKGGTESYTMKSVPGKIGGALDGMNAARLRQELAALRESEAWTGLPLDEQKKEVKRQLRKVNGWFGRG